MPNLKKCDNLFFNRIDLIERNGDRGAMRMSTISEHIMDLRRRYLKGQIAEVGEGPSFYCWAVVE